MSGPIDGDGYTGGDVTGQQGTDTGTGVNPSWQEYLNEIPQEYHDKVTPAFEKWDKSVQNRFNQVHQQSQQFEPWKPIIDAGIDAETASFALRLLSAIEQDPKTVYESIGNYYKLNDPTAGGQGQVEPLKDAKEEDPYAHRFSEIERQNQIMAATLVQNQRKEMEAQAEAQLDKELSDMRQKYKSQGEFDERFVLAYMSANDISTEDAVKSYYEYRDNLLKQHGQKPLIMGSGGGVPQVGNIDVRKLNDRDTKNLVVEFLQKAAAERKQ